MSGRFVTEADTAAFLIYDTRAALVDEATITEGARVAAEELGEDASAWAVEEAARDFMVGNRHPKLVFKLGEIHERGVSLEAPVHGALVYRRAGGGVTDPNELVVQILGRSATACMMSAFACDEVARLEGGWIARFVALGK
jgi:hypothetical protein